jgi:hypothetical protein
MKRTQKHTHGQASRPLAVNLVEAPFSQVQTQCRDLAKGLLGFKNAIPDEPGSLYRFGATFQLLRGIGPARRAKFLRLIRRNIFA